MDIEALKRQIHYNPDTGEFRRLVRGLPGNQVVGSNTQRYRVYRCKETKALCPLHRVAFAFMGEEVPAIVDHINGDGFDNRWCNLRAASVSKNNCNRKVSSNSFTGIKNVNLRGSRFVVRVKCPAGEYRESFPTLEEAEAAAIRARNALHGEFARHK